jgi:2-oxoglutarate ferredoxin oxidoreductase subunit gamma
MDTVPEGCLLFKIPATRLAEKLGRTIVANIVMLGFITSITGVVGYEAMKQALFDSIPSGTEELNLKAFEKGYEYGKKQKSEARSQETEVGN